MPESLQPDAPMTDTMSLTTQKRIQKNPVKTCEGREIMKVYEFGKDNEKLVDVSMRSRTVVGIQKLGRSVIERLSCISFYLRRT